MRISNLLSLPFLACLMWGQIPSPAPPYSASPQAPEGTPPQQSPAQLLSPEQLDNLVAPIALYPDPLLGQVLAASTYPLEIVEAQQWLQQHSNLRGPQLMDAARQQNWDPSVQALVAFPDVMELLTRDVQWTTDLGNAFLAQQADVMGAVQRMRARAQQNGRLATTPQQTVTTETQNRQSAIAIQPADPQVIYVPSYNPMYVWGPPAWGAYPPLWYPPVDNGWGFGPAVFLGSLFAGLLGWGGWGWGLSWLTHALFLNNLFFSHFGFHGFGGGFGGTSVWAHNPVHRLGVPYANAMLAGRYNAGRYSSASYGARYNSTRYSSGFTASRQGQYRSFTAPTTSYRGAPSATYRTSPSASYSRAPAQSYRNTPAAGYRNTPSANYRSAPSQSYRSFSRPPNTASSYRSAAPSSRSFAPAQHYSAPRSSSPHYSTPHFSGSHSSGGHFSGGHSSSHSSGGHSGGGSHKR